ncbi:DUF6452 family protein [Phocaeicola sp.]
MKRIAPVIILLFLAVSGFLLHGCSDSNCPLNTVAYAHFDFLSSTNHVALKWDTTLTITGYTQADVIVKDTLEDGTIKETVVKDSILNDTLYNKERGLSSLSLPLSYTAKTTYVIHYSKKLQDVIEVTHRNIPFISDIECGTMMFYQVESVKYTTNSLDSVVIVNPNIDNEEKKNFNIYYTIRE